MSGFKQSPYEYEPSLVAAVVFAATFGTSTIIHTYQLFRGRTWYFIPFLVGNFLATIGYIVRAVSVQQGPNYERPAFIIQTLFILISPAFYAASIYMVLGRIILLLEAERYALIRRKWLTAFFVTGDVISLIVQAGGGGLLAATDQDMKSIGEKILIAGLFVQLVFFGFFVSVTALFHYRIHKQPTTMCAAVDVPWLRYIYILYAASALVMVRSIFRVIEFIQGRGGELQQNEVYFYVLDTALMLILSVLFNIFHPQTIIARRSKDEYPLVHRRGSESA